MTNITDDVLMDLDLIKQHQFQLDLENSVMLLIAVKITEQGLSLRKAMLQGNDLPRTAESRRLCLEGCKLLGKSVNLKRRAGKQL